MPVPAEDFNRVAAVSAASVDDDGNRLWHNGRGQLHREDGPAVVWTDGREDYYLNGEKITEEQEDVLKTIKAAEDERIIQFHAGPLRRPIPYAGPVRFVRDESGAIKCIVPPTRALPPPPATPKFIPRAGDQLAGGTYFGGLFSATGRPVAVGDIVPGEGIYLGPYRPKDRAGNSLGKIFNAFAAPEDLPETMKYVDAVKHIAKLKKWNGHNGESYATDKEFYAALKNGTYKGGWIIPTRELLIGTEADGPTGIRKGGVVQPDNLYDHREKGALKGTFKTAASSGTDFPQWYWSCTERRDYPDRVWNADFSDGYVDWIRKDIFRLSCRLVRLVPVAGWPSRVRPSPRKRR